MPVHIEEMSPGVVMANDADPTAAIENLTRHIRALWHHVERLEHAIAVRDGELKIRSGDAVILLKKDGTIMIDGKDITVQASGKINVKATSDLVLKGSRILEN
jgi:ribosomal protein S17